MDQKIYQDVQQILKSQCGVKNEIHSESVIQEDLDLDSVGLMTLVVTLEQKYGINFDDVEEYPVTIGDVVSILEKAES